MCYNAHIIYIYRLNLSTMENWPIRLPKHNTNLRCVLQQHPQAHCEHHNYHDYEADGTLYMKEQNKQPQWLPAF